MRLDSRIATVLWLVAVIGVVVFSTVALCGELFGFSPWWLEAVGDIALVAAAPAFVAFLVLHGRAHLRGRRSA